MVRVAGGVVGERRQGLAPPGAEARAGVGLRLRGRAAVRLRRLGRPLRRPLRRPSARSVRVVAHPRREELRLLAPAGVVAHDVLRVAQAPQVRDLREVPPRVHGLRLVEAVDFHELHGVGRSLEAVLRPVHRAEATDAEEGGVREGRAEVPVAQGLAQWRVAGDAADRAERGLRQRRRREAAGEGRRGPQLRRRLDAARRGLGRARVGAARLALARRRRRVDGSRGLGPEVHVRLGRRGDHRARGGVAPGAGRAGLL